MEKNDIDIKEEDLKEEDFSPEELEAEDVDWKAKAQELKGIAKRRATQLGKAKAKLGEFETKIKELTPKIEPKPQDKKENLKSGDKLLERLDKMSLQVAGIKEADEIELFNKWKEQTGREADDIVGNNIFKKELENLRITKANQEATSNIKGEMNKSGGAKSTPEYWIAKATKDEKGQFVFPEETPKELYTKILNKIAPKDDSVELKFYNS